MRVPQAQIRDAPAFEQGGSSPGRAPARIVGRSRQDLGLGLLLNRADGEALEVLSPVAEDDVVQVHPGLLILDEDFTEKQRPASP